jgi:hypothetical protein
MVGRLIDWVRRWRRDDDHDDAPAPGAPALATCTGTHPPTRPVAAALAETLDRAMELGLWAHAERVAATAVRLAPQHPGLTERLARLRLARGAPEAALQLIAACPIPRADLRLLRCVCLAQVGRSSEAHGDLHRWARHRAAPAAARRLLAHLEWQDGDLHAAAVALRRNLACGEDPRTIALLLLLSIAQDRPEQIARWARRLQRECTMTTAEPFAESLLESLGVLVPPEPEAADHAPSGHVARLAAELAMAEDAIPALVEAAGRGDAADDDDARATRLLADALERALPSLADPATACEALARLAVQRGDTTSTLRWCREGLRHNPMSAALALMLEQHAPAPATRGRAA